jgi:hypothetical protein
MNRLIKALHWTAIPLHSIAAGELCRYTPFLSVIIKVGDWLTSKISTH